MKKITLFSLFLTIPSTNQATLFSPKQPSMASSVSSLFLSPTTISTAIPLRRVTLSTKATPPQHQGITPSPPPPPPQEKKSFAVVTGELFLGIASRILKKGGKIVNGGEESEMPVVEMFAEEEKEGEWWWRRRRKERIAAVVEDPVQPEVVWEQRVKDVEAERRRKAVSSPGFSFSAAGLLFPYHLGVAHLLIEKGYIKETTPLAGSSAGAIVCAVIASGASMQEALKATKILAEDCRLRGTAFRLGAVLRDVLDQFLPDDVHIRSNGRVRVAVTEILWRPRGLLVDQFDSKEDLIDAVFTSSFIPGYLAPRPATMFRNRLCIDGGLTLFMPPTSAAKTVRVCAFPASRLGLQGIGISPDCNPENRASPRELFNWALEPAADDILDKLFELGYLDAAVWADKNPVDKVVQDDNAYLENGQTQ
ncbi:hypothetical protein Pfo_004980 [Paulownia fortunei]|nr:hypothetical protein Pfo_004980 [Paulownia fortunei]